MTEQIKKYHLIDSEEKFDKLEKYLQTKEIVAVDTETNGLHRDCKLMGVCLSVKPYEGFYIPVCSYRGSSKSQLNPEEVYLTDWTPNPLDRIKRLFKFILCNKKLLMWNATFDLLVLEHNLGMDLSDSLYSDVMMMKHTLFEERPHGLKECGLKYLGEEPSKQRDLQENVLSKGGKWQKSWKDMFVADIAVLYPYGAGDADLTLRMFNYLSPKLNKKDLTKFFYEDEVMPLVKNVIWDMVQSGVEVDIEYFTQLKIDLATQINALEGQIHDSLKQEEDVDYETLETDVLIKANISKITPKLRTYLLESIGVEPPTNKKTGKVTYAKDSLDELTKKYPENPYIDIVCNKNYESLKEMRLVEQKFLNNTASFVDKWGCYKGFSFSQVYDTLKSVYRRIYFDHHPDQRYILNIDSPEKIGRILKYINRNTQKPEIRDIRLKTTPKGNISANKDALAAYAKHYQWTNLLLERRKSEKLLSTYVEPILKNHINGRYYPDWLGHGTISGRMSGNFQQLPRDDKRIKKGIVAKMGYKLIITDYEQLEARGYAHVSGDENLINAFFNNEDIYSTVGMKVFGKTDCTPFKKGKDSFGEKYPELRQISKTGALAVVYGARKWQLSRIFGFDDYGKKGEEFTKSYFEAFPKIEQFIYLSHRKAKQQGFIKSEAGRYRNFDGIKALSKLYKNTDINYRKDKEGDIKNKKMLRGMLNNATNFQIQSLAASIINRASAAIKKDLTNRDIDARIIAQIHDELVLEVIEESAESVAKLVKYHMENTYTLTVPLIADPVICNNYADGK